jgi:serine/threonine-protein kinase
MPPSNPQSDRVATPAVDVGAIRDALGALAVSAPCALPRFAVADDGVIRVSGLVGAGGPDGALREAVHAAAPEDSLSWGIRGIVGPYCDVFDTVRPIVLPGTPVLGLALKDKPVEATRLRAHEFILPIVSLPAFPAYLQVDYFSHDGSVAHLFPVRGGGRIPFGNNAIVKLGLDPRGKPNLEVGAPFGTDLIVAIASSVPLFPPGQERNDETVQTYLPALKAAIEAAKRVNATLTARPLIVDTVDR